MLRELLSREPKHREPPPVEERYILHKTEANTRLGGGVIFIETVMCDPSRFRDLKYFRLLQHPSQPVEEFARLADLALGLAAGTIGETCYCVPKRRSYPPMPGISVPFFLAENVAREIQLTGRHPMLGLTVLQYPMQTAKGLAQVLKFVDDALEKYRLSNPVAAQQQSSDIGGHYDPGVQPEFVA